MAEEAQRNVIGRLYGKGIIDTTESFSRRIRVTRGKSHSTWIWQAGGAIIMDATPVGRKRKFPM
jgi:hypothetical protein